MQSALKARIRGCFKANPLFCTTALFVLTYWRIRSELSKVKLYRKCLVVRKRKLLQFSGSQGASYRGFELPRVKLQWKCMTEIQGKSILVRVKREVWVAWVSKSSSYFTTIQVANNNWLVSLTFLLSLKIFTFTNGTNIQKLSYEKTSNLPKTLVVPSYTVIGYSKTPHSR